MNTTKVVNCSSPELCARFERRIESLANAGRTGKELIPEVAYHGTSQENVARITETGFLLSKLSTNTGNRGAYGAGIYCSPQASYCVGYARGGRILLVCAVLMGRRYTGPKATLGANLVDGFDSHTDYSGNSEWVLFDEASILPCFHLHF